MAANVSKARQAGQRFGAVVGGVAVLGALGYFIALPVVGSFVGFQYRMSYYREHCDTQQCVRSGFGYRAADWRETLDRERRQTASQVCPYYLNGSMWQQWVSLRNLSWCEAYPEYASK
ncbi:hypothetical protein B5E41_29185 [Rhizobium esperanzae]|uniref:Uncharacterized protein n=1 Tax=Rhizobium esperanzae TaxID=1967781 RepID=A0A246DL93_9HYPH|nr:hypothetical protein [Rhizobium esperanzae]OWO90003.1 hypothetical protein B5E41_29185 [Rhizobium esperanzae]